MSDTDAQQDTAHADIGIVCALPMELRPLLERCERVRKYSGGEFTFRGGRYDELRIAVVESGTGFARARRATKSLIDAHTPSWVISAGFSGGLVETLKVGDIVVADDIVDLHGHEMRIDLHMPADPAQGLHVGRIVTADEIVRTVKAKRQIGETTGGLAVDLESLAVAQVCQEATLRFLAVRVISDDLSADLPAEILSILGSSGTIRAGAVAGALWKRPASVRDLWQLRERAAGAAERLADFLDGVLTQLPTGENR